MYFFGMWLLIWFVTLKSIMTFYMAFCLKRHFCSNLLTLLIPCILFMFENSIRASTISNSAPSAWYNELKEFLLSYGFVNSHSNTSLFLIMINGSQHIFWYIYVDDLLVTRNHDDPFIHFYILFLWSFVWKFWVHSIAFSPLFFSHIKCM